MKLFFALSSLPFLAPLAGAQTANLSSVGTASQSSTYHGTGNTTAAAENAIDGGGAAGKYFSGDCTHTENELNAWWRVDLNGLFVLSSIQLYNRTDCCPTRLSNFHLSVEDSGVEVWGQDLYVGSGYVPVTGGELVTLPAGLLGDAIQIQFLGHNNDGNGYLTLAEVEIYGAAIGTTYCSPANANSTGQAGVLATVGSSHVNGAVDFGVVATQLPKNQFGYMLCSLTKGSVVPPGSQGVLCLSGEIGRFKKQVENTDHGVLGIVVDTAHLPLNPPRAIVAGETWHFQAWYRDGGSSNFTDAVSVSFQ